MDKIDKSITWLANSSYRAISSKKARKYILGFFIVQAIIVALSVRIGYPPDELFHIRFIEYLASHGADPFTGTQTGGFHLGDVSRTPEYLYQYVMGLLYRIIPFGVYGTYLSFRFVSIALSAATLLMLAKLGDKLRIPTSVTNVVLLLLANSAQFLFLSASVNSDLLVWFLVVVSVLLLVNYLNNSSLQKLFILAGIVALGMVTKRTYMPVGFFVAVAAAVKSFMIRKQLFEQLKRPDAYLLASVMFFVLGFGLFSERVGVNLAKYQQIKPACLDLHTEQQCIQNGVERRNLKIRQAKIVDIYDYGLLEYGFGWSYLTVEKLVGTQGWTGSAVAPPVLSVVVLGMSTAGLAGSALELKANKKDRNEIVRLALYVGSLVFIIYNFWFNYQVYHRSGIPALALQGRYVLPTATIFLLISGFYVYKHIITTTVARRIVAAALILFVLSSSGLNLILASNKYTDNVFKPWIIYNRDQFLSEHEPSI